MRYTVDKPQLITSCGITAVLPNEKEYNLVKQWINSMNALFNGDLFNIKQALPLIEIKNDKKDNSYYIESNIDDPMVKFYNLFHIYFWEQMKGEVAHRIIYIYNICGIEPEQALPGARAYIEKKILKQRYLMTMQNSKNKLLGKPIRQSIPMEESKMQNIFYNNKEFILKEKEQSFDVSALPNLNSIISKTVIQEAKPMSFTVYPITNFTHPNKFRSNGLRTNTHQPMVSHTQSIFNGTIQGNFVPRSFSNPNQTNYEFSMFRNENSNNKVPGVTEDSFDLLDVQKMMEKKRTQELQEAQKSIVPSIRNPFNSMGYSNNVYNPYGLNMNIDFKNKEQWMIVPEEEKEGHNKLKLPKEADFSKYVVIKTTEIIDGKKVVKYHGNPVGIAYQEKLDKEREKKEATNSDFKQQAVNFQIANKYKELQMISDQMRRYDPELADKIMSLKMFMPQAQFDLFINTIKKNLQVLQEKDPSLTSIGIKYNTDGSINTDNVPKSVSEIKDKLKSGMDEMIKEAEINNSNMTAIAEMNGKTSITDKIKDVLDNTDESTTVPSIIEKLMLISDVSIFTSVEDSYDYNKRINEYNKYLNPYMKEQMERYQSWKPIMRQCVDKSKIPEGMTFDQWYDNWWNGTNNQVTNESITPKEYREMMTGKLIDRLNFMCMNQVTDEERKAAWDYSFSKQMSFIPDEWSNQEMTALQFFNDPGGMAYGYKRMLEEERKEQYAEAKKKYKINIITPIANNALEKYYNDHMFKKTGIPYSTLINSNELYKKKQGYEQSLLHPVKYCDMPYYL